MDLTQLLAFTLQNDASDLHLSSESPPIIRAGGQLKRVKADPLTSESIRSMLYSVMTEEQRADYERDLEADLAISFGDKARFRVNAFNTRKGAAAVFRIIPSEIPTMEELQLPPAMRKLAELHKGIVLVTGATGSGKSTTLAAMINHINKNHNKHILTIEDPVEFFHHSDRSLINHRELGEDTHSFAAALKSALREDPDVILVGEMRDYQTISLALTAAETGHLVFGTLHANSAAKTVDRIIDVFPAGDKEMARSMLAGSLEGVIAQQLLKRDGGGRVGAFEILIGTNAVKNLIRENQIPQMYSMMQTGSRYGMITMEEAINNLLQQGLITEETARHAVAKADDEGLAGSAPANESAAPAKSLSEPVKKAAPAAAQADDDDEGYSF
ncbi:MAG: type IV pilus twitching motility protein PilT [Alphaproteobacteria bacterium]|nr:type IV pilus twitching motility protein PilT [Alphaproteobacteria bacterium]